MPVVALELPEEEAKDLYRLLHTLPDGQDQYCQSYRQLQAHFFQTLTVDEVTGLLKEQR